MKIRVDFVTNSSSSSFILAFKDEQDFNEFKEICEEYDYESVYKLILHFRNLDSQYAHYIDNSLPIEEQKEKVKSTLRFWYSIDVRREYFDKHIDQKLDWAAKHQLEEEMEKSEDFNNYIDDFLKTTDYYDKVKKIEESSIFVDGMIWDTCGGVLEYAIRNGLLENEFRRWVLKVLNIG